MIINEVVLTESISDIVFHHTTLFNAQQILTKDKFQLTPTFKNDTETNMGSAKKYFLSTSRSRTGDYHSSSNAGVLFTLDGRKMNSKFKGAPVDYWGREWNKDEMEDRVYTDDNAIPALQFIKEINIHSVAIENDPSDRSNAFVLRIYSFARKNNIPVNVYSDIKSLMTGNKKNAISHEKILDAGKKGLESLRRFNKEVKPQYRRNKVYSIAEVIRIAIALDITKLDKKAASLAHDMARDSVAATRKIAADGHNNANSEAMFKISKLMKQFKVTKFGDLISKLGDIYYKQIQEQNRLDRLRHIKKQYENDKEFYDHVNSVIAKKTEFDFDRFNDGKDASYMYYRIEEAIRNLDTMGILVNASSVIDRFENRSSVDEYAIKRLFNL